MLRFVTAVLALCVAGTAGGDVGDLARARALMKTGDLAGAERILVDLTEAHPEQGWALSELALVELRLGRSDAAIAAARRALAAPPGDHRPAAAYNLSLGLEAKGDAQGAIGAFEDVFKTPAILDRIATLRPPAPPEIPTHGDARPIQSVAAWCRGYRAEQSRDPENRAKPSEDLGAATADCGLFGGDGVGKVRSPVVAGLGRVSVAFQSTERDHKGYGTGDITVFLVREAAGVVEAIELASLAGDKSGSARLDRLAWTEGDFVPGGAHELRLSATHHDETDYGQPTQSRGTFAETEQVFWIVGLDDKGHLAAFGPLPSARSERAEPGSETLDGGAESALGKAWQQSWSFAVKIDGGVVELSSGAPPVPARDRHRLGRFPIRLAAGH